MFTSNEPPDESLYFVSGVLRSISVSTIVTHFSQFGDAQFHLERDSKNRSLGYGWLKIINCTEALESETPHVVNGCRLTVLPAKSGPKSISNVAKLFNEIPQPESNEDLHQKNEIYTVDQGCVGSSSSVGGNANEVVVNSSPRQTVHAESQIDCHLEDSNNKHTDEYVCIPLSLCPSWATWDPRVLFAQNNPHENSLKICPPPWAQHFSNFSSNSTGGRLTNHNYQYH